MVARRVRGCSRRALLTTLLQEQVGIESVAQLTKLLDRGDVAVDLMGGERGRQRSCVSDWLP